MGERHVHEPPALGAGLLSLVRVLLLSLGGCALSGDHFTGVVTTTTPKLCLGNPEAAGDCFEADPKFTNGLKLDECVTVT